MEHFYPRSPCGERLVVDGHTVHITNFYPRSPCGERLLPSWELYQMLRISIHALLAESDKSPANSGPCIRYFYPRSPCGERLPRCKRHLRGRRFLSTLSLRRATPAAVPRRPHAHISIHALLAESDTPKGIHTIWVCIFLSTLSLRRATNFQKSVNVHVPFLSTLSLRRATHH